MVQPFATPCQDVTSGRLLCIDRKWHQLYGVEQIDRTSTVVMAPMGGIELEMVNWSII